ncbi:MAG: helix-turn-helix domain-containing protein [Candidatus Dormibacteraeota bacterium]|nr:helix-turn-helix domain-containing protein [Candidatus Dormibacteraeota bacterium]
MVTITPHLLEQANRVADLLANGYSNARIADELQVSRPRVSQIRRELPALRANIGNPSPTDRLLGHRDQLVLLRGEALQLAAAVRRDLRDLEGELQSARVDRLLGLRR